MKNKTFRLLLVVLILLPALCLGSCAMKNESAGNLYSPAPEASPESPSIGMGDDKLTSTTPPADIVERKIIKTYDLNAETKEFDATVAGIDALVKEYGGYVESNSITNRNYNSKMARYASYRFRIPAENADAFVNSIGNTLNVTRSNSYANDVSESYYSIEATLKELQTERDSLLNMMASLDTQNDYNFWLTIQTRLSEVRQQIARLQAQLNIYDSRVEYSTVNLSINEVVNYTPAEEESFGTQIKNAFATGWNAFCEFIEGFTIFLAKALPFLVLFAIILTPIILIVRHRKAKKKAKKLAQKSETL